MYQEDRVFKDRKEIGEIQVQREMKVILAVEAPLDPLEMMVALAFLVAQA